MSRLAAFLVLALSPVHAFADAVKVQARTIDCYCTDSNGGRIELGESICLQVGGRMFTAQCQMSLNVPMWRETQEGCLSSDAGSLSTPLALDLLQQPVKPSGIDPQI